MQQLFSDRNEQVAPRRGKSSGHGEHFMFHDAKYTSLDVKRTSLDVKYTFHVVKHKKDPPGKTFLQAAGNICSPSGQNFSPPLAGIPPRPGLLELCFMLAEMQNYDK